VGDEQDRQALPLPIVVLPLPDSPISEITSPGGRSKLTLRSAGVSPPALEVAR
jgi:hypothetical protein